MITIDRPEVRNALRFSSYDELERAVRTTTARCLVITGADPAFCSGDDVRVVMGGGDKPPVTVAPRLTPAADALLHSNVPIVAAVNGAAVGWGMELALMADIRWAARSARFSESYVKVGLVPGDGGAYLLKFVDKDPKSDSHVVLRSLNPAHSPIRLDSRRDEIDIVAEFVRVMGMAA